MQTSYSTTKAIGFPGNQADSSYFADEISRVLEAAAGVNPGLGLVMGTNVETQAKPPTATGQITGGTFLGVCMRIAVEQKTPMFADKDVITIGRKGRFYVTVEGAVTAGTSAFCRFASGGGGTVLGAFRADADTATAVAVPNGRFLSSTSGAGVAILELS